MGLLCESTQDQLNYISTESSNLSFIFQILQRIRIEIDRTRIPALKKNNFHTDRTEEENQIRIPPNKAKICKKQKNKKGLLVSTYWKIRIRTRSLNPDRRQHIRGPEAEILVKSANEACMLECSMDHVLKIWMSVIVVLGVGHLSVSTYLLQAGLWIRLFGSEIREFCQRFGCLGQRTGCFGQRFGCFG